MNMNVWDVNDAIRELIARAGRVDPASSPTRTYRSGELVEAEPRREDLGAEALSAWASEGDRYEQAATPPGRRRLDLARRPFARVAGERRVHAPDAGAGRNRGDLEPDHLRQGDQRLRALRPPAAASRSNRASEIPQEIFFELALEDVRRAADALRAVYELSDGRDGFVSFECTPDLADDAEATVRQALEVSDRLDVPNLLIKVAATDAGIKAIEELTARGVNVNVTLLFSLSATPRQSAPTGTAWRAGPVRASRSPGSPRWLRSSSPGSTQRLTPGSRRTRRCADGSRSPTPSLPTPAIWGHEDAALEGACRAAEPAPSVPFGRAPRPRTPTTPTFATSRSWSPRE